MKGGWFTEHVRKHEIVKATLATVDDIGIDGCMKRTIERLEAEAEIYRLQGLDHVAEIIEDAKGKMQSSLDIFLSFDPDDEDCPPLALWSGETDDEGTGDA